MKHLTILIAAVSVLASCAISCKAIDKREGAPNSKNGVYYWKTTFSLDKEEQAFLSRHNIRKLYLRMFDVAIEDWGDPEPIATIKFETEVPDTLEIVPTVFITLDALERCEGTESEMAEKIVKRVNAICSYNEIKNVREVQFDCDWTRSTRLIYYKLCSAAMDILHKQNKELSGTIRLHQVEEVVYPFDRGVLMLYNTGAIKDPDTENSIISYSDVRKYLGVKERIKMFKKARKMTCREIDFAYPTFCWGVVYHKNGSFDGLVDVFDFENQEWLTKESETKYILNEDHIHNGIHYWRGQFIRTEYSDIDEVLKVKKLVDKTLRDGNSSSIIYHLDSKNLSKYTDHEIEKIYR